MANNQNKEANKLDLISRIDTEGMRESPYFPRFPITLGQLIRCYYCRVSGS